MTFQTPAFIVVDQIDGLTLNRRKSYWVQYGSESCQSLLDCVATNCENFERMKIAKYAKYVGTMIGPEGHVHRWTAPRKIIEQQIWRIVQESRGEIVRVQDRCRFCIWVFWIHTRTGLSNPQG